MSGKIVFTVTTGAMRDKVFTIDTHDTLLFGRKSDCQIYLPDDPFVSRHHFILEVNPPDARIRDLGSLHGTYINGQKYGGREKHETPEQGAQRQYPQVDLHNGDEIQVGKTILSVKVEEVAHVAEQIYCQRCRKDASAEVGAARQGDYLCATCQNLMQADLGGQWQALLQQLRKQGQANVGISIPGYHIEHKLGEGGMGAVYLVRHTSKDHRAALKVMLSKIAVEDRARQLFLREVEVTRSLRHRNIVEFLEYGALGSIFYFLLEYCEGGSMHDFMKRGKGRLTLQEAGPLLLQTLEGLAYAHKQGFVHRDLKPQNILLSSLEGHWIAKIADLGLAKNFELAGFSGMTVTGGDVVGSYPFMPREQIINFKYSKPVSDVWSMGATCYHVLTGSFPRMSQRGQDPIEVILNGTVVPIRQRIPHLPLRVAEVIDRSLSTNTNERYQHAGDMHLALAKALKEA